MRRTVSRFLFASGVSLALGSPLLLAAEKPTVDFALQLAPIQSDIEFDRPSDAEAKECTIDAEAEKEATSWVVRSPAGVILRKFQDTNGDNKVDHWCYFKDGIETYRDIDSDFNGKADQYRWLGTSGIRWGRDENEDGRIDQWLTISPEEVTAEVIASLRDRDTQRFTRLLLTSDELQTLGLGKGYTDDIERKLTSAAKDFSELARSQAAVSADSQWIHFGGSRPGVIPAGTDGSTKDVYLYDNVSAIVDTKGKHAQIAVGQLVRVGEAWRLIDLPANLVEGEVNGYFFQASLKNQPATATDGTQIDEAMQRLISDLDVVDKQLASAASAEAARLHAKRADVLEDLAKAAKTDEDRAVWLRQFADTVSAAVQSGAFPQGLERLEKLCESLGKSSQGKEQLAYVRFSYLSAEYGQQLQDPKADYLKIQENWLGKLNEFVKQYPQSPDSAQAMLQLAIAQEFAGKEKEALEWYTAIATKFPESPMAPKAAGARRRLESVGQPMTLQGKTLDGRALDLATAYKGKTVVIHYWATWCEPCKQDMASLKQLLEKYNKQGFAVVGVNLDTDSDALRKYLTANKPTWHHVRDAEGLDGPLANQMGILTLPTMILVDKSGRVVNRSLHSGELEQELQKLLR